MFQNASATSKHKEEGGGEFANSAYWCRSVPVEDPESADRNTRKSDYLQENPPVESQSRTAIVVAPSMSTLIYIYSL